MNLPSMSLRSIITSGIIAAVIALGLAYIFPHLDLHIANKYVFMAILITAATVIGLLGAMIPLEGAEFGCLLGGVMGAGDLFHRYLPDMGMVWMFGFIVVTAIVATLPAKLYDMWMK